MRKNPSQKKIKKVFLLHFKYIRMINQQKKCLGNGKKTAKAPKAIDVTCFRKKYKNSKDDGDMD